MKRLVFAAAALVLAVSSGHATSVVDQSYLPSGATSALTVDNNVTSRAQTFTVGLDGFLTGVRVNISDKGNFGNSPNKTLTIGVFGFDGTGIDIANGPLLTRTSAANVGSTSLFDYKLFETIFDTALQVAVGDTFALVLSGVAAGQNDGYFWAAGGDAAGYAGGAPWRTNNGVLTQIGVSDHQFQTLVDTTLVGGPGGVAPIPIPATLPLLLAGLGAIGLVRRRQRA